jgi:histone deacetylase 11
VKEPSGEVCKYNSAIYPDDIEAAQRVKYRIPLKRRAGTTEYLGLLSSSLPKAIREFHPGLIVYNAGTDIFVEDRLGNLSVTEDGIIGRDEFVFHEAIENKIPILMVLSGGYNKKSGYIIAKSINNIMKKGGLLPAPKKK